MNHALLGSQKIRMGEDTKSSNGQDSFAAMKLRMSRSRSQPALHVSCLGSFREMRR